MCGLNGGLKFRIPYSRTSAVQLSATWRQNSGCVNPVSNYSAGCYSLLLLQLLLLTRGIWVAMAFRRQRRHTKPVGNRVLFYSIYCRLDVRYRNSVSQLSRHSVLRFEYHGENVDLQLDAYTHGTQRWFASWKLHPEALCIKLKVKALISSYCPNKQSDSDTIPTWLLKICAASVLTPTITNIVNLSLSSGQFHPILKESVISPLLKKPTLDKDQLSNYRPISNLSLVSKIIERVVKSRLTDHLVSNGLHNPHQSAYCKHHSTETALLYIHDVTCPVLLFGTD